MVDFSSSDFQLCAHGCVQLEKTAIGCKGFNYANTSYTLGAYGLPLYCSYPTSPGPYQFSLCSSCNNAPSYPFNVTTNLTTITCTNTTNPSVTWTAFDGRCYAKVPVTTNCSVTYKAASATITNLAEHTFVRYLIYNTDCVAKNGFYPGTALLGMSWDFSTSTLMFDANRIATFSALANPTNGSFITMQSHNCGNGMDGGLWATKNWSPLIPSLICKKQNSTTP
ncbi:unnamed protein product, partial [Mesorhabditis belari]|uniref:Uncharacterized protein n=1 Tax=Mesorhabditis belari TaxID=2138241 RepID=A0AAF3FIM4_9BILA